jgi:hypothetical protein
MPDPITIASKVFCFFDFNERVAIMVWKEVLFYSMSSRTQKHILSGELGRSRISTKKMPPRFSETAISDNK